MPAAELVPGDLVKLSLGGVVAADVTLTGGEVLLDQSMLTGESVPIEAGMGVKTYAGALVRRGEAEAEVTATGPRTKFGRTAELVRTAHVVSSQQKAVLRVVRNLAAFNGVVIVILVAYAWFLKMPVAEIIPLRPDGGPGIDSGGPACHLHLGCGAGRPGFGKTGCSSDPPLGGGRSGFDDRLVFRQDRHADPERIDGDDRSSTAWLRRSACFGPGGAGQLGGWRRSGRWRHPCGRRRQARLRRAEIGQVCSPSIRQKKCPKRPRRIRRKPTTHRKRRLCGGARPGPSIPRRRRPPRRNSKGRAFGYWRSRPARLRQ